MFNPVCPLGAALKDTGRDRLIDLMMFRIKDFVTGLNVRFIQVALIAELPLQPLFLQVTYGISAFEPGLFC